MSLSSFLCCSGYFDCNPGTQLCSEDVAVEGGLGGFYPENGPVFDGCPKIQGAKCRSVIREYLQTGRYS